MSQHDITASMVAIVPFAGGIISLLFCLFLNIRVKAAPQGDADSQQVEISKIIQDGAMAFLKTEYLYLLPFVVGMSIFFFVEEAVQVSSPPGKLGWKLIVNFVLGAILSAASGWGGMMIATTCNVKTAEAAKIGLNPALKVAFAGGGVMGFIVVGLGLVGLTAMFWIFADGWDFEYNGLNSLGYDYDECTPATATTAGTFQTGRTALKITEILDALAGFSFGASAIALFARVAGGIYTKAADVGADLVGKVEAGFPEDSYYNPATIADNVGDNVGDVAGMGADLFESYVGSIIAAATLATTSHCQDIANQGYDICEPDMRRIALPFWVSGMGVIASLLGFFAVGTSADDEDEQLQAKLLKALHSGVYLAAFFALAFAAGCVHILYGGLEKCNYTSHELMANSIGFDWVDGWLDFTCIAIGLFTGIIIGEATEIFTSYGYSPTQSITKAGITGPATVIIQGLGIGMLSAVPPVIVIAAAIMSCAALSGVYGAALAAVGMLMTLAVTLATDAYGPVADNAGGVAEMSHLVEDVRKRTDALDALGNTTAATGKGFAVGSAVLSALAFFNAFSNKIKKTLLDEMATDGCSPTSGGLTATAYSGFTASNCRLLQEKNYADFFSLTHPLVLSGLLIGAMLPFLFAALTMLSVGKAATGIIMEVRRQLDATPLLRELGKKSDELKEDWADYKKANYTEDQQKIKPDYNTCVAICTMDSLKEMILPGVIAVMTPIGLGLLVGARCLGGLLMGAIATGFLLAVMMNNAGGAWDNSKKWVENEHPPIGIGGRNVEKNDAHGHHAAVVVGDTVGDPFKDTSGPALNILIKMMSVLSLTCAGLFRNDWETYWEGIVWLAVELLIIIVVFYYVWWKDETQEKISNAAAKANTEMTENPKHTADVGVSPADTAPADTVQDPGEGAIDENTSVAV